MAKKLDKERLEKNVTQENDLEVLHPERYPTIAGVKLTIREYGFVEGLQLRPQMKPLLDSLYQMMKSGDGIFAEQLDELVAAHVDDVLLLVAQSASVEVDWIKGLTAPEGDLLLLCWWSVNGPFFVGKLQSRLLVEARANQALATQPQSGETPTPL